MIPNADTGSDGSESSSLYGVSLVFQRTAPMGFMPRKVIETELVFDDEESSVKKNSTDSSADSGSEEKKSETKDEEKKPETKDEEKRVGHNEKENFDSPIHFQKHNFEP